MKIREEYTIELTADEVSAVYVGAIARGYGYDSEDQSVREIIRRWLVESGRSIVLTAMEDRQRNGDDSDV